VVGGEVRVVDQGKGREARRLVLEDYFALRRAKRGAFFNEARAKRMKRVKKIGWVMLV